MALGSVDTYLPSPYGPRDEGFMSLLANCLRTGYAKARPSVQVVGEQHSARGHEVLLTRKGIPFEIPLADS
jgi:hypothetical protein